MDFRSFLKDNFVILDGGMGSLLQAKGLKPGELPERWNVSHPDVIKEIQTAYFDAGSNVVNTNTFGANIFAYSDRDELKQVVEAAIDNAYAAARESAGTQEKFVSLDVGPLGQLLKPLGNLDFEDAVNAFKEQIKIGADKGVDLISIETMNDSYETKAALLAAHEVCNLPVIVSNAYDESGRLMTGASPSAMVALLEGMGADALGTNCSLGPYQLRDVMDEFRRTSSTPIIFKPNAGLPRVEDGKTVFDITPDEFADEVVRQMKMGVRIVGGCCGTTPEYIRKVCEKSQGLSPLIEEKKNISVISSYTHAVTFGNDPILIGERINPTGKKRFKQALIEKDMDYILNEGLRQVDEKVHVLDVNVGIPDIDEPTLLTDVVKELQAVTDVPLQIDTSDPVAMEKALRVYNGKAMINSVNGKEEVMNAIFPLVKKYGGFVVALTIDEAGIPETKEGRISVANKIIAKAAEYGIEKKDLIFDPLCMTISADTGAALTTLECVSVLKNEMGVNTSLGVSNVSFGLPKRNLVNSAMFAAALERGLSAAIMNPFSADMMTTYYTYRALHNLDENCMCFIEFAGEYDEKYAPVQGTLAPAGAASDKGASSPSADANSQVTADSALVTAVIKGLKENARKLTKTMIESGRDPLDIVQNEVIPALNIVGEGFETKKYYLPQLLMSAEAAKEAFGEIKDAITRRKEDGAASGSQEAGSSEECRIVIATVKGDVHDIGKNIVKLLLENYGFTVTDLGKDVPPEVVVEEVIKQKAQICALSALMTTTVPAMEDTIKLVHEKAPWCKVTVGGAVLTREYADKIGADGYSKDAMGAVRYVQGVINK